MAKHITSPLNHCLFAQESLGLTDMTLKWRSHATAVVHVKEPSLLKAVSVNHRSTFTALYG
jgi:hypothetical protein